MGTTIVPDFTGDGDYERVKSTLLDVIENDGETLREVIGRVAEKTNILLEKVLVFACDILWADVTDVDNPNNFFPSEIDR